MTIRKTLADIKSFWQQNNTQAENTPSKNTPRKPLVYKDCLLVAHKAHLQDSVLCPNAIKHRGGWMEKKKILPPSHPPTPPCVSF